MPVLSRKIRSSPPPQKAPSSATAGAPPLQLPVTRRDAPLNLDGSGLQLAPGCSPRATLSPAEIERADGPLREVLTTRLCTLLAFRAGVALGTTCAPKLPADGVRAQGGVRLAIRDGALVLGREAGPSLTVRDRKVVPNPDGKLAPADPRAHAADVLSSLLVRADGSEDPLVAAATLHLLGPGGPFAPLGGSDDEGRLVSPKLIAWDFNGTVQDDFDRVRVGLSSATEALRRMGGACVLTTSMRPEEPEAFLEGLDVGFAAYVGGRDVRPTSGPKRYAGIAGAFGLSPEQAARQLVCVGDSSTDIAGDFAAALFIHDAELVPASAVELLVAELDLLGEGDLSAGLNKLVGDRGLSKKPLSVELGPLRFDLALREVKTGQGPRPFPTVSGLRVELPARQLVPLLARARGPQEGWSRACRLAFEHLASSLPEEEVAPALRGAQGDGGALREAGRLRLERRAQELASAREQLQGYAGLSARPVPAETLLAALELLAGVGDPQIAQALAAHAASFAQDALAADQAACQELSAYARQARALLREGPSDHLCPTPAALTQAAARVAEAALCVAPLEPERQKSLLEALAVAMHGSDPASVAAREAFEAALDDTLTSAEDELAVRIAGRLEVAPKLAGLGDYAAQIARRREATVGEIAAAVEERERA